MCALLLLGGPGADVAVADPGRHASDRDNSSTHRGAGDTPDRVTDKSGIGTDAGARRPVQSRADAGARRAPTGPSIDRSNGVSDAAGAPRARSGRGSGSDASAVPRSAYRAPRVTFGNGRAPSARTGDPAAPAPPPAGPAPVAPAPPPLAPPPPPPPPPAPAPSWVKNVVPPPLIARQYVVAPAAAVVDPLWGIAGLVLVPAAGAVLGYRQARALQAADRSARRSAA